MSNKGYPCQIFIKFLGNTVTVMSPDGKPIQVSASALQAASAQNAVGQGMLIIIKSHEKSIKNKNCQ